MKRRATHDIPEVARILGISRNAAYNAVHRGEIPALRIGKLLLVPRVALEELLKRGTPQAAPTA